MHRSLRQLALMCLGYLILSATSQAQSKIERETCLHFPKLPEALSRGVHFTTREDLSCEVDCDYYIKLDFNYRYDVVTILDHYSNDGKLITTTQKRSALKFESNQKEHRRGEWAKIPGTSFSAPVNEEAQKIQEGLLLLAIDDIELKVKKELYESAYKACDTSYYR